MSFEQLSLRIRFKFLKFGFCKSKFNLDSPSEYLEHHHQTINAIQRIKLNPQITFPSTLKATPPNQTSALASLTGHDTGREKISLLIILDPSAWPRANLRKVRMSGFSTSAPRLETTSHENTSNQIKLALKLYSSTQSCPTLCDPMDGSLLGSSVHGTFQARILGRVTTSSSRRSFQLMDRTCVSCVSYTGRQILYHYATCEAPILDLSQKAEILAKTKCHLKVNSQYSTENKTKIMNDYCTS